MALLPLKIPAGVVHTGTEYDSSGRWREANLVRWRNNAMRPVGGWEVRKDTELDKPPRAIHSWRDNTDGSQLAIGFHDSLYHLGAGGILTDISPSGLTAGNIDAQENRGFSGKFYGTGYYGVTRPSNGVFEECDTWSLDNFGEYLIGCLTSDGKIYEWQLNTASDAAVLSNAPTNNKAIVVTEERFVFALASGGNPRKIAWSDREDNNTWTPSDLNEAGDIELQTNGEIMTGIRMRGRTLILTTTDAHVATYQGPPYVYGFERVGTACGAVSRKSVVAVDEGAFWMGKRSFFVFNGSSVTEIPCDVCDYIFADINDNQASKAWATHNAEFGEIWWFFPSNSSTEIDSYVSYNYKEGHWQTGKLNRTCGVFRGVFQDPIWCDETGIVYNHETGLDHGIYTPYAETAPISIGAGDGIMKVNSLIPDAEDSGDVQVYFKTRFHPQDEERTYGAYTLDNPTSVRFSGRQIRMRVESARPSDWRVGTMRVEATQGGRR